MRYLALVLFAPAFAILVWLYWRFPREPATRARRTFDLAALALSLGLTWLALEHAIDWRPVGSGPIWPQVAASLAAFHVFPFVLGAAWLVRRRVWPPAGGAST